MFPLIILILSLTNELGLCTEASDCDLLDKSKEKLDLLKSISLLNGHRFFTTYNDVTYAVSICSDLDKVDTDKDMKYAGASKKSNKQQEHSPILVIGRWNETTIAGDGSNILLTYGGGDVMTSPPRCNGTRWSTLILLTCHPTSMDLKLLDELSSGCFVSFNLLTSVICPLPQTFGRTTVFLLLLTTGLVCYLVIGVAYKRIVLGAKGVEQFPNHGFWSQLYGSCADMCRKDDLRGPGSLPSDTADEPLLHP